MERARAEREFEEALERIGARVAALRAESPGRPNPQIGVLEQQLSDARMRLARLRARHGGWDRVKAELEADLCALESSLSHWTERVDPLAGY